MSDCPALPVLTPEKAALLRALVQERLAARRARKPAAPVPPPRYDEVFFVGTAWLDRLSYDDSFEDLGQDR